MVYTEANFTEFFDILTYPSTTTNYIFGHMLVLSIFFVTFATVASRRNVGESLITAGIVTALTATLLTTLGVVPASDIFIAICMFGVGLMINMSHKSEAK